MNVGCSLASLKSIRILNHKKRLTLTFQNFLKTPKAEKIITNLDDNV